MTWEEKSEIGKNAKKEYLSLFPSPIHPFFKLIYSDVESTKEPFLSFTVVRKKNVLVIHKVNLNKDEPLEKLIFVEHGKVRRNFVDHMVRDFSMKFQYCMQPDYPVNNIFMTIDNELPEFKKNYGDSIINYRFIVHNVVFRYEKESPVDFIFTEEGKLKRGVNVCFVKRNKSVYILTCYANDISEIIDQNFLPYLMGISKEQRILQ